MLSIRLLEPPAEELQRPCHTRRASPRLPQRSPGAQEPAVPAPPAAREHAEPLVRLGQRRLTEAAMPEYTLMLIWTGLTLLAVVLAMSLGAASAGPSPKRLGPAPHPS